MVPFQGGTHTTQVFFEVVLPPVQTQFISTLDQSLSETLPLTKSSLAEKQNSFHVEEIFRRNLHNSRYRAIWGRIIGTHGSNRVVRAKFRHNLPPESIGSRLRFLLKLELLIMHHLKLKTPNPLLHTETLSILIFKFIVALKSISLTIKISLFIILIFKFR